MQAKEEELTKKEILALPAEERMQRIAEHYGTILEGAAKVKIKRRSSDRLSPELTPDLIMETDIYRNYTPKNCLQHLNDQPLS